MALGRPAMRGREARKVEETLKRHNELMQKFIAEGMGREAASRRAYAVIKGGEPEGYAARVRQLEAEGLTTSDAQGVADAEFAKDAYSFHGVQMTQVQFAVAMAKRNEGQCPFCDGHFKNQYGAMNRHIVRCAKNKRVAEVR